MDLVAAFGDATGGLSEINKETAYYLGKLYSKKVTTHPWNTLQAIPRAPTMKGFPLQPVGKGLGVCSKGVLKQP